MSGEGGLEALLMGKKTECTGKNSRSCAQTRKGGLGRRASKAYVARHREAKPRGKKQTALRRTEGGNT